MDKTDRGWLITGVSTGFGRALAEAALDRGDRVVGTLRRTGQIAAFEALAPGRATGILMDLDDARSVETAMGVAVEALGGAIDILVNNAGVGSLGTLEELDEPEVRRVLETNFYGSFRTIKAAVSGMRERGSGAIVNFSSAAGFVGIPGSFAYSASKFALEGMSESLAEELAPFGISVTIVEPGAFRTEFNSSKLAAPANRVEAYAGTMAGDMAEIMHDYHGVQPGDPIRAAQVILAALDAPAPPLRLALGADALEWMRGKLAVAAADFDEWEAASLATAYPSPVPS